MYEIRCFDPRFENGYTRKSGSDLEQLKTECDALNAEAVAEGDFEQWWISEGETIIYPHQFLKLETAEEKVNAVLGLLERFEQYDGESHHQTWLLDQTVRLLTREDYHTWIEKYRQGDEYEWSEGIAP